MQFPSRLVPFLVGCALTLLVSCTAYTPKTNTPTPSPSAIPSAAPTPTAMPLSLPQAVDLGMLGKGMARSIVWAPGSRLLAVTSPMGVYLYDPETWQVVQEIPLDAFENKYIQWLTFSGDGKSLIVTTGYPASFWRYDLPGGPFTPWFEEISLSPQSAPVFSPDGSIFAVLNQVCVEKENGGEDCFVYLELRHSLNGELRYRLEQTDPTREKTINTFVFSPDGSQLAAAHNDNCLRVWDTTGGELLHEFVHESNVTDIAYSPTGRVLASASKDATVRFWDTQNGKSLFVLRGFSQGLQKVAYLEDGKKLLVGQLSGNIFREYILDEGELPAKASEIVMEIGENYPEYFAADGVVTVKAETSPDAHTMAVLLNNTVQIWDLGVGRHILSLPGYTSYVSALAFSPDGSLLALADHNVHLWQVADQQFVATLEVNTPLIQDMVFHPAGKQLAIACDSKKVEIWDVTRRQKVREINADNGVRRLAYSSDGKKLALATWRGVQIWDAEATTLQREFTVGEEFREPLQVAFSADGNQVFYMDFSTSRWGWDIPSGEMLYAIQPPLHTSSGWADLNAHLGVVWNALSPFRFFDPATGRDLYAFASLQADNPAALSPDGRLLVYYKRPAFDLLDASAGNTLLSFDSFNAHTIFFSPDSRFLAAASYDGIIHVWDISALLRHVDAVPRWTATPAPTVSPTPTATPAVIHPLALRPLAPPTPIPGALGPDNAPQMELLGELGLGRANTAAWSPDGKFLAIGGSPGAYLFEIGAVRPVRFLPADEHLVLLAFSPDGRLLAGQMSNSAVQVWDVPSGRSLYTLEDIGCWNQGIEFSPDSGVLSAYCGQTYRWSMDDGQLLSKGEEFTSPSATNPNAALSLQVGMEAARLLDSDTREIVKTFDLPGMAPALARFSPDGKTLLVWFYQFDIAHTGIYYPANNNQSIIQLWNILPGQAPTLRTTLAAGEWNPETFILEAFQGISFTADNQRLATASRDGWIRIWDVSSGELLHTLPGGVKVYFSPDASRLVSLGKTVEIWDIPPEQEPTTTWAIPGFGGYISSLAFTQNGQEVVAGSEGIFRLWQKNDTAFTGDAFVIEAPGAGVTGPMTSSPDGKWLAYSTTTEVLLGENTSNAPTWHILHKFTLPNSTGAHALVFSSDGSQLAASVPGNRVFIVKLGQPEMISVTLAAGIYIAELHFSSDGRLLLGSDHDLPDIPTLYLWDTATGELLRKWKASADLLAFSPDGRMFAACYHQNGERWLFDMNSGKALRGMQGEAYIYGILFSPDGRLLVAAGEKGAEVWDVASGKLLRKIEGNFNNLAFSPDGQLLALSPWNGKIQIWGLPVK